MAEPEAAPPFEPPAGPPPLDEVWGPDGAKREVPAWVPVPVRDGGAATSGGAVAALPVRCMLPAGEPAAPLLEALPSRPTTSRKPITGGREGRVHGGQSDK